MLDQIFIDFDVDQDGVISEKDLQSSIYELVKTKGKNDNSSPLEETQKRVSYDLHQPSLQHPPVQFFNVPELELELETERDSARETERQT